MEPVAVTGDTPAKRRSEEGGGRERVSSSPLELVEEGDGLAPFVDQAIHVTQTHVLWGPINFKEQNEELRGRRGRRRGRLSHLACSELIGDALVVSGEEQERTVPA